MTAIAILMVSAHTRSNAKTDGVWLLIRATTSNAPPVTPATTEIVFRTGNAHTTENAHMGRNVWTDTALMLAEISYVRLEESVKQDHVSLTIHAQLSHALQAHNARKANAFQFIQLVWTTQTVRITNSASKTNALTNALWWSVPVAIFANKANVYQHAAKLFALLARHVLKGPA